MSLSLSGMPLQEVNVWAAILIVSFLTLPLLGFLVDRWPSLRKAREARGFQKTWVLAMLFSSYALLVPALGLRLFNLLIGVLDAMTLYETTESMLELIKQLWKDQVFLGAVLIAIFAIAIPLLKLTMLLAGETMRGGRPKLAHKLLSFVQAISKWACPDMFAYILLSYLVKHMDHSPTLNGLFHLDLGFTCYALFCLGSTISSLGMQLPKLADKVSEAPLPKSRFASLMLMAAIFVASFAAGLVWPCMALRLDIGLLVERGTIPESLAVMAVDQLHLPELAKADVTIPQCIALLADFSKGFDLNSLLALLMLAVFVIAVTILDMMALLIAALQSMRGNMHSCNAFVISQKLNKLAMLDVATLGIVVIVFSGRVYEKQGVVISFGPGVVGLIAASLCHHAVFQLVSAYPPASPGQDEAEEKSDENDSEASTAIP